MEITLKPELQQFADQQARRSGYRNISEYIDSLLDREWKRQLGQLVSGTERESLKHRLAEGAAKRAKRDRKLAREWSALEEELYGAGVSSLSRFVRNRRSGSVQGSVRAWR